MLTQHVDALRSSVARLRDLVVHDERRDLTPGLPGRMEHRRRLSHLGSGAVIMHRRLDDTLTGLDTPDDFAPRVWDTWNAKAPTAQRDDALTADTALLAGIDRVTPDQRAPSAWPWAR